MKNLRMLRSGLLLLMAFATSISQAQDLAPAAKKGFFSPFFFRAGVMSGVLTTRNASVGTISLRTEYGLSSKFSVVGDVQAANGNNTLSGGQGSIAMRYQPLNLGRFQPYVSVGIGIGSVSGEGRHCHHQPVPSVTGTTTTTTTDTTLPPIPTAHHHKGGIGLVQFGANFRVAAHFVASAEGGYQTQISRHPDPGSIAFRAGMSYQFGR